VVETALIVLVLVAMTGLPFAVAVVPPVVMAVSQRWPWPAVAAYLVAVGLLAGSMAAASADIDRADATGGSGSILAGGGWLAAAVLAAAAAVLLVRSRVARERLAG